jgi:DNA-binding CsgD family transcriptional regulator
MTEPESALLPGVPLQLLSALNALLGRLGVATIFLDAQGRLLSANREGLWHLDQGTIVCGSAARPTLRDARAAARLTQALAAVRSDVPEPPEWDSTEGVALVAAGEAWLVDIVPLIGAHAGWMHHRGAGAVAITLRRSEPAPAQRLKTAVRRYELTPAEARVVNTLLAGRTIGSAARALGISEATVKTHLQHIFDKTGTRRQVDLVKLLAGSHEGLADEAGGLAARAAIRSGRSGGIGRIGR